MVVKPGYSAIRVRQIYILYCNLQMFPNVQGVVWGRPDLAIDMGAVVLLG